MSVLNAYFDADCNQLSPCGDEFMRNVRIDENGKEFEVYEKVDNRKIIESHGDVDKWSLRALMQAGINPQFSIHTTFGTNLEKEVAAAAFLEAAAAIDVESPKSE